VWYTRPDWGNTLHFAVRGAGGIRINEEVRNMDSSHVDETPTPYDSWRAWVTRHPTASAAISGLVAVQVMTLFAFYLKGVGLPNLAWPHFNGAALSTPGEKFGSAASFFAGQSLHMADGVTFAVLFALFFRSKPPLSMVPDGEYSNLLKALGFSTLMAIISMGFLVPYVYVPKSGFGFFSFGTPDGWKLPFSILVNHWMYGGVLGFLYNPRRR
jgi:hypothetical protein